MINHRQFLRTALLGITGSAVAVGTYTRWIEPHWVEIVRRRLPIAGLPDALRSRTLVQLSDLHIGPQVDDRYLIRAFNKVSTLAPDLLSITGDFISYRPRGQFDQVNRVLEHLPHGKLATLAVLGNHDYGPGWKRQEVADRLVSTVKNHGIQVLRNEMTTLAGLQIVGIDDFWGPNFHPELIMPQLDTQRSALVLCHNPDACDQPVWGGFQGWILSGHTHGGQCRPPFLPPPLLPVTNKRYTAGEFELADNRRLYINRGLGHWLQVRFNVRPEITVLTLC
jgi:predicted MPP superfamily phosphohydrolase